MEDFPDDRFSTADPSPLDPPLPTPADPATIPAKGKRGRKSIALDPDAPAPVLRRSKRHSSEATAAGPSSSVKLEVEAETPPPPKKKRGRPSKADIEVSAAAAVAAVAVKTEEEVVKEEKVGVKQGLGGWAEIKQEPTPHPAAFPPTVNAVAGPSNSNANIKPTAQEIDRSTAIREAIEKYKFTPSAGPSASILTWPATSTTTTAPRASPAKKPRKSAAEKAKEKAQKPDKRAFKLRAKAPQATMQRAQRVMTQRMYLVNRERYAGTILAEQFKVLGSTGNVYTVKIDSTPSCNCPDCLKGNLPCKHIIFVFLKVLKVPDDSPLWYQRSFLLSELEEIFTAAPADPAENLVSVQVRNAYLKAMGLGADEEAEKAEEAAVKEAEAAAAEAAKDGRKWTFGDDCPVCYDEMTEEDEQKGRLVFDEAVNGCGKPLHAQCFKMWAATARAKGDDVTCVWCRTAWPTADAAGAGKGKGKARGGLEYSSLGYLNMADMAGMSRQRDTSTYYQGPIAGRSWDNRYADD